MKTITKVAEVKSNATFNQTVKMGVDNESLPHIIKSLTDIYQDGYLAAAREYISNGYDATVKRMGAQSSFGVILDRPIEVTLPSRLNPVFTIRDYGTGMTRQILAEVYPKYGASTKRDNNVEAGGFGLGAKSAFSIVSSFVVTSICEGKKNTVIFEKGEDGVGVAKFLDEQDTTEDNGTVVSITLPDPARLTRLFNDSNLLLGFPHNSVQIDGRMHVNSVYDTEKYRPVSSGWVLNSLINWENNSTRLRKNFGEKIVLVGPIAYTFHTSQLGENYARMNDVRTLDEFTVLNLPIGSVDLTPARDSLIFSDRTRKAILHASMQMRDDVYTLVDDMLKNAKDKREAANLVQGYRTAGLGHSREWKYNGEVVPRKQFIPVKDASAWHTAQGYKTNIHHNNPTHTTSNMIVVCGVPDAENALALNRFRKAFESKHPGVTDNVVIVYTSAKKSELDPWLKHLMDGGVFTAKKFEEQGIAYRKVMNEERRANRGTVSANGANAGTMPVSVLRASYYARERPEVNSYPAATFVSMGKVVYIQLDKVNTTSLSHKFAENTANTVSNSQVVAALNYSIKFLSKVYGDDVRVIRVPATMKLANLQNIIPNLISMDDAMKEAAEKFAAENEVNFTHLSIHGERERSNSSWTVYVRQEQIQNAELAEWVLEARKYYNLSAKDRESMTWLNNIMQNTFVGNFFSDYKEKLEKTKTWELPLLSSNRISDDVADEITEYVNFKFPA